MSAEFDQEQFEGAVLIGLGVEPVDSATKAQVSGHLPVRFAVASGVPSPA